MDRQTLLVIFWITITLLNVFLVLFGMHQVSIKNRKTARRSPRHKANVPQRFVLWLKVHWPKRRKRSKVVEPKSRPVWIRVLAAVGLLQTVGFVPLSAFGGLAVLARYPNGGPFVFFIAAALFAIALIFLVISAVLLVVLLRK